MGCKDAVLPESLLKNYIINCLTYEQNTKKPYKDNLCLFRALALHLHANERLEAEASKLFNLFLINSTNPVSSKVQGVCMDDIPSVEGIVVINNFINDIDLIDGAMVGELAQRSIKKYEKSVQLIRYNSHICYVDNIHALFKVFPCPTCDTFFRKTGNLERHLVRCSERVKHIYPKNVYQLRETLFDKLDSFDIQYTDDQKLYSYLAVFDFESIYIPDEKFKNTKTTTWIGKQVPISVSISSNLKAKPIFLCNCNPRDLVESFIDAVEGLATQGKAQMKLKILEIETAIKSKLTRTLESLNERRCRKQRFFEFEDHCFEDDNEEKDSSTQFCKCRKINWLSSKNILNVTATYYQCSDSLVQNKTSTWSNLICYLFSSMREKWNLLWFKKSNNLYHLNSVMFCFWILWSFSVEQQALTRSLKPTKQQKFKGFSLWMVRLSTKDE